MILEFIILENMENLVWIFWIIRLYVTRVLKFYREVYNITLKWKRNILGGGEITEFRFHKLNAIESQILKFKKYINIQIKAEKGN